MTVPPIDDIVIGETHLSIGGELVTLLKCPYCAFRNIHEEEIRHHIRYKDDSNHAGIDAAKLDRKLFIVIKNKKQSQAQQSKGPIFSHSPYIPKEDLPDSLWPWVKCVWCSYRDRLPRDLQWHFIEKHKSKLYNLDPVNHLDPSYSLHDIEESLDKALNIAKKKTAREGNN